MSRSTRLVVAVVFALLSAGCGTAPAPVARAASVAAPPSTQPIAASAKTQAAAAQVATPAAFDTAATSQPPVGATPSDAADIFDAQLQRLVTGDTTPDPSLSSLPPDERDLLGTVVDTLSTFRSTLRSGDGLMATRVAPLLALSDRIKAQTPLALPTLALCRSVTQFGVYDPVDPPRFPAGKETQTIVYCEVDSFTSMPQADGSFETKLSYESVLYNDNEHSAAVVAKKPANIVDRCRNRRRDFFLADRLTLPASLPAGKYVLKVTVVDQLANHVAERTVPIALVPAN